jgi:MFS family permease
MTSASSTVVRDLGLWGLALLYFLISLPKALLLAVIPMQALALLGSVQAVSVLYFTVSCVGVVFSVSAPALARRINPRGVFVFGALSMMMSAPLLGMENVVVFTIGMVAQVFGFTAMEIALTLFVLQIVPRREVNLFEPKRVLGSASAYFVGPWLGVYLEHNIAHWVPFIVAEIVAVVALLYMLAIGLHKLHITSMPRSDNPLKHVARFASQPRLRLAWVLTLGRAGWWTMYFIYVPIYCVTSGLGEVAGGVLVSAGVGTTLTVTFWGWIGRRFGLRRLMFYSAVCTGVAMIGLATVAGQPWLGTVMWLVSAMMATPMDGVGNIPFMRAVRPSERSEMTAVFMTVRDASQLLPPGVFSIVLRFFELPAVFVVSGIGMFGIAWLAKFLPRRM